MNTIFDGYEEWAGEIATRSTGSLISFETGDAVTYGLFNAPAARHAAGAAGGEGLRGARSSATPRPARTSRSTSARPST